MFPIRRGKRPATLMVVTGFILSTLFGIGLAVLVIIQFALDGLKRSVYSDFDLISSFYHLYDHRYAGTAGYISDQTV